MINQNEVLDGLDNFVKSFDVNEAKKWIENFRKQNSKISENKDFVFDLSFNFQISSNSTRNYSFPRNSIKPFVSEPFESYNSIYKLAQAT